MRFLPAACWLSATQSKAGRVGPLGMGRLRRVAADFRFCAASLFRRHSLAPTATAVLIQPNLDVGAANNWQGPEWDRHIAEFTRLAGEQCKTYIAGIPQTGAPTGEIICPPYPTHPDLVVWPESPAPFIEGDPQLQAGHAVRCRGHAGAAGGGRHRRRILAQQEQCLARLQLRVHRRRRAASSSAATTKSTSCPSASTFPSRICSPSRTSSPAASRRSRAALSAKSFCSTRRTAGVIATASSSAMRRSSPTRCASSRATAPRCW